MADCISRRRSSLAACTLLLLGPVVCLAAPKEPGKVAAVRFWSLGDVTRVAVEVSSEFQYHAERLTNPARVFFDIRGARPLTESKAVHVIPVGDSLVKQIRVADSQPGVTRVVLDLSVEDPIDFTAPPLSKPDPLTAQVRRKA